MLQTCYAKNADYGLVLLSEYNKCSFISFIVQTLTGGTLLLRNKYYIVIYRGKDFVPTSVAAALAERQELASQVQEVEEKVRCGAVDATPSEEDEAAAPAGSLAEFYEAQERWGRDISTEEREKMMEEASKAKSVRLVKQIEHKLAVVSVNLFFEDYILEKYLLWIENCRLAFWILSCFLGWGI